MTTMVPLDIESLQDAVRKGLRPKFLFFWGHTGKSGGAFGKECLSQWYVIQNLPLAVSPNPPCDP